MDAVTQRAMLALAELTDCFLEKHGCFPLDNQKWRAAMAEAYALVGQPNTPARETAMAMILAPSYRSCGKQVLLGTTPICDAANEQVAQQIAERLSQGAVLDVALGTQEMLQDFFEAMAADDEPQVPDLGDIACANCRSYTLSENSKGQVICNGAGCPAVYETPEAAWEADKQRSAQS